MQPLNKEKIDAAAEELGLSRAFVEKDWYVVQTLLILSKFSHPNYQLIFSGGTSLSKGFGLIQRFSEDIDFKVYSLEKTATRKVHSSFYDNLIDHLKKEKIKFKDTHKKGNKSKFLEFYVKYDSVCPPEASLRPEIQVQMTIAEPLQDPIKKPIQSFIKKLIHAEPEIQSFPCINPLETAADKVITFTWRVVSTDKNDGRLVRHLYDLASINKDPDFGKQLKSPSFMALIDKVMREDIKTKRFSLNGERDIISFLKDSLDNFNNPKQLERNYKEFVMGMISESENNHISFQNASDVYREVIERYIQYLSSKA